jgi:hypothetical protein
MTYLVLGYAVGVVLIGGFVIQTWRTLRDLEADRS